MLAATVANKPLAVAAATAGQPQPATLQRGAGVLLLVPNRKAWHDRARPLQGAITIRGTVYSGYTVGQLMTQQGLLLQHGKQQRISVKLASEFLQDPSALSGFWSSKSYTLDVWPGRDPAAA